MGQQHRRGTALLTAAVAIVWLAACGSATTAGAPGTTSGAPEPPATSGAPEPPATTGASVPTSAPAPPGTDLTCDGTPVPRAALDDPTPATALSPTGLESLRGVDVPPVDDLAAWSVAADGPDGVVLVRALATPVDDGTGQLRLHEVLATQPGDDPAGNGWLLRAAGPCTLREPLPDGLGDGDLALDPANPPSDVADSVTLLVTERACASGRDAEGRVEVVRLVETPTAIEVVLGVRPGEGAATCPSNPPTAYVLALDGPLRERAVRDASTLPVRTLAVGAPAPLDCTGTGMGVSAIFDYAAETPGMPGDPATVARSWAAGGLTLDDRLDVQLASDDGPTGTLVTVERDGRTLGRVTLQPGSDGGLLVGGYEACSGDDPFS